ncbi:helix-turn-helix domain-containing protein [Saccharothrix sp. NPDC042600]|uniref:helix-turn-helix transcriptional regulator n=1 Tax=Saccharothrix TaxID=2071 RepID=UPI0033E43ED6
MTVDEFCRAMGIARSTFNDWKAKKRAPRVRKLPNGKLRIDRSDIQAWYDALEVAA